MAETIGFLILSAVGVTEIAGFAITATTATIIGTAAILAVSIGLQFLLGQPAGADLPRGSDGSQALRQPIPNRLFGYGRCRMGGYWMLYEVRNGAFCGVVAVHSGRICGFVSFYLHDDLANVVDGIVTGALGATDGRYAAPAYLDFAIAFSQRLGLDRETSHYIVGARVPDLWTPNHRGDGIASVAMVCQTPHAEDFSRVFPQQLPQVSFVGDWLPVFDPRDSAQDRRNVDTLGPCYNPVLQAIDFATSREHGLGFDYDICIAPVLAQLMAEADICDELVLRADGSYEPRYRSSGFWSSQNDPASTMDAIMSACDGWYAFNGDGTLTIIVGRYRQPTVILKQQNIYGFEVNGGVEDENFVNILEWSFTDPANKYRDAPGMAWRNDADILDRGIARAQTIPLTWVQSHSQGRRLIKRKYARINPRLRGNVMTDFAGIEALRERWVIIQDDRHPWLGNLAVEISKVTIDLLAQALTFEWISIDPNAIDAWDPLEEEGFQPSRGDDNPTDIIPVPAALSGVYASGTITLTFDDLLRPDLSYVVQWRIGAGTWTAIDAGFGTSDGTHTTLAPTGFTSGHTYELQVASKGSQGTLGDFSASAFVTS